MKKENTTHMEYLKIADVKQGPAEMPQDPPINYKFPLDPFQQHALKAICQEENVLVTAKTGSGKTLVGEVQIAYSLRKGMRVFYTTPIKSLSNQKFNDLKAQFGEDKVGIMTGDIKFSPDADIVIMTTEILRNLLFKQGSSTKDIGPTASLTIDNLDAVIFDECHYINDKDRGHIWEEIMILLPPEVKMIMLSATLDHPEYFAEWLGALKKRPINLISTEYRIVPLTHTLWYKDEFHVLMDAKNKYDDQVYKQWISWRLGQEKAHDKFQQKVKDARAAGQEGPIEGKTRPTSFLHQMNALIVTLEQKQLLPALFFVLSRKDCEKYAQKVESTLITSSEKAELIHIWNYQLRRHKAELEKLPQYHHVRALVERGIAFHHSGLIPMLKEIIEILFSKGFIKVLFATETFAVGINMPTKTAVFVGVKKFDEEVDDMRILSTAEYLQMAGRAGRRGLDTMGTVIYLPDRNPLEPHEMWAMMCGGKAPVTSRMEFDYDFILKTIHSENTSWMDILENSYWRRQRQLLIDDYELEQDQITKRLAVLKITAYELGILKHKEEMEYQLTILTNSKRRKMEQQLQQWHSEHNGLKWDTAIRDFTEAKDLQKRSDRNSADLVKLKDTSLAVERKLEVLKTLGYLRTDGTLTTLGVLATELNECDSLLISQLYLTPEVRELEPQELLVVLAGCILDGKKEEPKIEDIKIPHTVKDTLYMLGDIWDKIQYVEDEQGSPLSPWRMSTSWIGPLWDWIEGGSLGEICARYGVYEGNMMRSIMKLYNMLEEWRCMATFCEHSDVLEKFREAHMLLLRKAVIQDSLYLHT
jgi:superfamily II RNA helicase